jgi:hypothetical protein
MPMTNTAIENTDTPVRRGSSGTCGGSDASGETTPYPHRQVETFDGTRRPHFGQVHDRTCSDGGM